MLMMTIPTDPDPLRNEDNPSERPANLARQSLAAALSRTLDNIAVGVVLVDVDLNILHANYAAKGMLSARSPVVSLGGQLVALRADLTTELKQAITFLIQSGHRQGGVGVPLINRDMTAAAAHIMPLACSSLGRSNPAAAIFVTSASQASRVDLSTVTRSFRLTPIESRLLRHLVSGKTLREAADALELTDTAAANLQSAIFAKVGVTRLTDLMILIGHLVPPIFQPQFSAIASSGD